jgi:predicted PurR-regulated permease PerM
MPDNQPKNQITTISLGTIFNFFLVALLFFLVYYLLDIVMVVLTSIVLASFASIVATRMTKFYFNRTLAVVLIYTVSILTVSALFYFFIPVIINEFSNFISTVSVYLPKSSIISNFQNGPLSQAKEFASGISGGLTLSGLVDSARDFISGASNGLFDSLSLAFGGFMNLFLIVIVSFYLSVQEKGIENFLRIIIPPKYEDYAVDLWTRSERKIALWIRGQLLLGLLIGILIYLGLSILGVRYALLLAFAAAIFELVPFGIVLAAAPGIIFAYLDGGLTLALMTTGFYIIVQQFESYLIQPLVVKKVVGISPLVVILSVMIGLKLAGFWGLILGIPVSVALLEFMTDIEKKKTIARSNAR